MELLYPYLTLRRWAQFNPESIEDEKEVEELFKPPMTLDFKFQILPWTEGFLIYI
jgi:hypothetical protein